ncbi:MAG: pectate lyase [Candidatus Latescibacteria bacterium]|jgi:PelA/Pel-15E family pectate lyase|nr:pectate lyase [Candidatus Latescibacterota bacterium]
MYGLFGFMLSVLVGISSACAEDEVVRVAKSEMYEEIDLRPLRDSMSHWRKRYGRDRNDRMYEPAQIVLIAENIVGLQNEDGGWPKDVDWQVEIHPDTVRAIKGVRSLRSTLDNRSTYTHVAYLAKVYTVTELERYRKSAERGLDFIFGLQNVSGGWRGWDVDAITYNDDVMLGTMRTMRDIVDGASHFSWVDDAYRQKAKVALDRAIEVTLKCQIVVNGKKTAWCQQHDHETLLPTKARSYELPSICPGESTGIVEFLMEIEEPSVEVIDAIEHAMAWFEVSKIEGIRVETVKVDATRFKNHTATTDRVVVEDATAPPLWARFHEVDTFRPFMCNRDGIVVYSLAEVALERRTGYGWYGGWPRRLMNKGYPEWKKRIGKGE